MKITKIQRVKMREQKIQLILLSRRLSEIRYGFTGPKNLVKTKQGFISPQYIRFVEEYVYNETHQIEKFMKMIDIFMRCDYNVQEYDEESVEQYILKVNNNLENINNHLM